METIFHLEASGKLYRQPAVARNVDVCDFESDTPHAEVDLIAKCSIRFERRNAGIQGQWGEIVLVKTYIRGGRRGRRAR